jgi:hypothetical protein
VTPPVLDAVFGLLGDLLIVGLVLLAVQHGAVPSEVGAAAIGYLIRAVVLPPLGRNRFAQLAIDWVRRRQSSVGANGSEADRPAG